MRTTWYKKQLADGTWAVQRWDAGAGRLIRWSAGLTEQQAADQLVSLGTTARLAMPVDGRGEFTKLMGMKRVHANRCQLQVANH